MSCQRSRGSARTHLPPSHPKHRSTRGASRPPAPEPCRRPRLPPGEIVPMPGEPTPADPATLVPGSAEAEAFADALLMQAKRCGLRLAAALAAAARDSGDTGDGLRETAAEIALSCAYTTERELARRRMRHVCDNGGEPGEGEEAEACGVSSRQWWLSGLIATDLDRLARRLGLTQRQAAVWTATIRGQTLEEIALSLGIGLATTHAHLMRAQRKARDSWLAVYSQAVRGTRRDGRRPR